MNIMSGHLRSPVALSALSLNQQLYSSLMSERGQKGVRLQCLPLQVRKEVDSYPIVLIGFLLTLCWPVYVLYIKLIATNDRFLEFPHFLKLCSETFSPLKQIGDLELMVSYICYAAQGGSLQTISYTSHSVSLVLRLIDSEVCKQERSPPIKLHQSFTYVSLSLSSIFPIHMTISCTVFFFFFASSQRYIFKI